MKIYYISPSTIPSKSANSIHVMNMCEALTQLGNTVELFSHSNVSSLETNGKAIEDFYGVNISNIKLNFYHSNNVRGLELGIAVYAVLKFIVSRVKNNSPEIVISRNLYSAVLFRIVSRKKIIYETHSPEYGFRKKLQKWLLTSDKVQTVVISNALKKIIHEFHSISDSNINIFHDAAREGGVKLNPCQRQDLQKKLLGANTKISGYKKIIGYFGHLYAGRGIEIIEGMANLNHECAFVVYGGNEKDIDIHKINNININLFFMGHISPELVAGAMGMMDVLLMPYQESVSVGLEGVDTAKWMSPMKMFEYMSVGLPIISSDLPVLREVLVDGKNCLLVKPDNVNDWSMALQRVVGNVFLAEKIGNNAYNEYKNKYTWNIRAKGILALV